MKLSPAEFDRYQRHIILPEIGVEGQERLRAARVLIAGGGGLGCPSAMYLCAAGVGTIGLAEFDTVDASNLQRQILYGERDVGRPKIDAAAAALQAQNSRVTIVAHRERVSATNALEIISNYDVV